MRFWYVSHQPAATAQISLHINTVSPEPSLPIYMKYGSRGSLRSKFLSHRIRISEILHWDRKSYLTHEGLDGGRVLFPLFINNFAHYSSY